MAFVVAAGSLLGGLVPSVLRSGRIDPLDWLLPGAAALLLLLILFPHGRPSARNAWTGWALIALPPVLFIVLAGAAPPVLTLAVLLAVFGLSAWMMHGLAPRGPTRRWLTLALWLALLGGARWAVDRDELSRLTGRSGPIGLMTALPLQGESAAEKGMLADFAVHGPLATALSSAFEVRPLDRLDAESLAGVHSLLLAQPRQLAPQELVALDRWVREGGLAVILADPLLRWHDPRPFGDPRRAPLTSLLDPLLAHWGLVLEPADLGATRPSDRRLLSGGRVLQLAAASTFTAQPDSSCRLSDEGLIATCPLGTGQARLVADADWIDDARWTLDPAQPEVRRGWISDAIPMLSHLLRRAPAVHFPGWTWLKDPQGLVSGLRWSLLLAGVIALLGLFFPTVPSSAHTESGPPGGKGAARARGDPDST